MFDFTEKSTPGMLAASFSGGSAPLVARRSKGVKMNIFSKMAVVALAAGAAMSLQAAQVLDPFLVAQTASDNNGEDTVGVWAPQVNGAGIIGGSRDIYVIKTAPAANSVSNGVTATAEAGFFTFSEAVANVGYGVLRWDGAATFGDPGVGVTDIRDVDPTNWLLGASTSTTIANLNLFGAGVTFKYTSDFVFDIAIIVYTADGISIAKQTTEVTGFEADGVTPIFKQDSIAFSELIDLATGLPIDLATLVNTRAIEVVFNGNLGQASVDLEFTPPTAFVPEPGAIALSGIALLGLAAVRSRKKN